MRKIMKTEGAVRRMGYGSCLLLLLVLFSCTSIDETLPECRLYVRFRYDYNMEFADAFHAQVDRVFRRFCIASESCRRVCIRQGWHVCHKEERAGGNSGRQLPYAVAASGR